MNRRVRSSLIIAAILIVLIFIPILVPGWDRAFYVKSLSWIIPLVFALFAAPIVARYISRSDIHFFFSTSDGNLSITLQNTGDTPFNFNRVEFVTGKKYILFGQRTHRSPGGIPNEYVEYHGADTSSRFLDKHTGYTIEAGKPVTLTLQGHPRNPALIKNATQGFPKDSKVYVCLYYYGSNKTADSQPIPRDIFSKVVDC